MSLKAVHLIFVTALSVLSFGTGVWKLRDYLGQNGTGGDLALAVGGFICGVLVIIYGRYFLKKLKTVGYL